MIVIATYLSFERISEEFQHFAEFSKRSQSGLILSKDISELQRTALVFTYEGHQSAADQVHYTYQKIHDDLSASWEDRQDLIPRRILLINKYLENYYATFQQVQKQRNLQSQLITVDLREMASRVERLMHEHLQAMVNGEDRVRLGMQQLLNQVLLIDKSAYLFRVARLEPYCASERAYR